MKLELTIAEINLILQALGNAPYAQVFELVEKIQQQGQAQMAEQPKEEIVQ
jgi:hypothetical protein